MNIVRKKALMSLAISGGAAGMMAAITAVQRGGHDDLAT